MLRLSLVRKVKKVMLAISSLGAVGLLALGGIPPGVEARSISGRVTFVNEGDERGGDGDARAEGGLVHEVVVYVDGVGAPVPDERRDDRPRIVMQNKAFNPHVEAVPVGGTISFPNLDEIMHNAFSLSRGNRFDLGLYKSGAAKSTRFENPGLVRIYCNIHPQMSAFVLVIENPYYTKARPDGTYRIENVPPGNYTVKAWSEPAQAETQIRVGERGATNVDFLLDSRNYRRKPHLNKHGRKYRRSRRKY